MTVSHFTVTPHPQCTHLPTLSYNIFQKYQKVSKSKKWNESTGTSPSKHHLSHYKCLLESYNNDNDLTLIGFNESMLQPIYKQWTINFRQQWIYQLIIIITLCSTYYLIQDKVLVILALIGYLHWKKNSKIM